VIQILYGDQVVFLFSGIFYISSNSVSYAVY